MRGHNFFGLLSLFLTFSRADTYFGYGLLRCLFTSPDDAVYLAQIYFNKVFLAQYNSTLGKYVGFTEKAREVADAINKNPRFLKEEKKNFERCRTHIPWAFEVLARPVEPSVKLRSVKAESSAHPGMLLCSVYGFFPKQIRVTWLRNGKEVTSDVTSTDRLSSGNWLYQVHSFLEYTPAPGERIFCMVEHSSLMEPKFVEWGPMTESERNKIAVGAAGLLLGLVFFVPGLIYYCKKNTHGRTLVPTTLGSPVSSPE